MIIVEKVLGNLRDEAWGLRLQSAVVDWLDLDQWEAQKNRFRKLSAGGISVAVSLDRGVFVRDGDVLLWDEAERTAVVARVKLRDVMVVRLEGLSSMSSEAMVRVCVELGHAIGNQHWPAVVKGDRLFVPLTVDRKVMASVMKTHAFPEVRYEFIPGTEVIPYLAPHEARRLFGGAEGPVHSHAGDAGGHAHAPGDHAHSHENPHAHSHDDGP